MVLMLYTVPVKIHRRQFPNVRNIARKPLHFLSILFMKNTIYDRNFEIKKISSRFIRDWVPSGSEFCRQCEWESQCFIIQYETRFLWKYDVALWIYTRCCLRRWNVLRKHHRFLQPDNDVLQDVDEIYSEKCSRKFTLYQEALERYLNKEIPKTKY
jgi:hypothetical protein